MIDLLSDAVVMREAGKAVASFTTWGDAYSYQQLLGADRFTVTCDTMLGYAVRPWITQPMSKYERQAVNA